MICPPCLDTLYANAATSAEPTPDEKAASIINSVPQSNLFTKTGGVILGTGLTAAAISSELYVRSRGSSFRVQNWGIRRFLISAIHFTQIRRHLVTGR
jgi:hypothetical protein